MQPLPKKLIVLTIAVLLSGCNEGTDSVPQITTKAATEVIKQEPAPEAGNAATAPAASQKATLDDPDVVVIVNGSPITKSMYAIFHQQWRQARQGTKGDTPQEQMAILNELVNAMLIVQDAEAQGFDKKPEVAELLNLLRMRALAEMSIANYVQQQPISSDELKELYDKRYGDRPQQEFKARHILLASEEDAKAVIKELDGGADFAELAKAKSTGPSASQGGELGWFDSTQMVKPFAEAVMAMENGTHSTAPVKTQFGWHVIFREDAREISPPDLGEVRDTLMNERRRELVMSYLTELRKKADIQIRPPAQKADDTNTAAAAD